MHDPFADKEAVRAADGPAHERAFARGSEGERSVARVLAKRLGSGAIALHDRAIPGRRGNIDHIVVAPSGVWVADAKRYAGKLVIWPPDDGREMLAIHGRDQTHLIDRLAKQVEVVNAAVAEHARPSPVYGALCFVETELPAGQRLMFEGFHLVDAAQLARRINVAAAQLEPADVAALADDLRRRFPPA